MATPDRASPPAGQDAGRVSYVTLPVEDSQAAAEFYETVFAWKRKSGREHPIFFEQESLVVALLERPAFQSFCGVEPAGGDSAAAEQPSSEGRPAKWDPQPVVTEPENRADESALPGRALSDSAGVLLSYNVTERAAVERLLGRALAQGARIRRAPAGLPWGGWAGVFESPDGHLWEVVWNPRDTIARSENNL
jgi:predicted lactoylglutathione lyase